jgi:hypothetical protein
MKHTSLPWFLFQEGNTIQISDSENHDAAIVHWAGFDSSDKPQTENEANAQFIVRACNSHYQLVEACKLALAAFEKNHAIDWSILEEAIAQAQEQP